jgi:hypothetical protein
MTRKDVQREEEGKKNSAKEKKFRGEVAMAGFAAAHG